MRAERETRIRGAALNELRQELVGTTELSYILARLYIAQLARNPLEQSVGGAESLLQEYKNELEDWRRAIDGKDRQGKPLFASHVGSRPAVFQLQLGSYFYRARQVLSEGPWEVEFNNPHVQTRASESELYDGTFYSGENAEFLFAQSESLKKIEEELRRLQEASARLQAEYHGLTRDAETIAARTFRR